MAGTKTIKSITTAFEAWPPLSMPPGPPPQIAKKVDMNPSHNMAGAKSMKPITTAFEAGPPVAMPLGPPPPPLKVTQKGNLD